MFAHLPRLLRFIFAVVLFELVLLTLLRVGFFIAFYSYSSEFSVEDVAHSFIVGLRFDIQLLIIINLPLMLFAYIKKLDMFENMYSKYFWISYLLLSNFLLAVIYSINFAYYDFFKKMVDSNIIRYFYDFGEAFSMLQEGYPVFSTLFGVFALSLILLFVYLKIYEQASKITASSRKKKFFVSAVFVVIYIFAGYGKLEFYPWRWSEAFFSSNNFLSYLASNPITYFTNTLKNNGVKYDEKNARLYYNRVANFLEVEDKNESSLSLVRVVEPKHKKNLELQKPNIIFVLGESTAYCRSSMSGNPLNPTPFLNSLAQKGLTYERYFTPHAGTARSVFTAMTGLSDVERMKTSSRNPMVVEQSMILNSLEEYEKFYFIGGSLSWGNVRGVISNVNGIITREESSYESPVNDVWGVSDADLLLEAHKTFKERTKPFFAFIQLAGNHSPWTIPENSYGFKKEENLKKDALLNYSFDGKLEEFNGQKLMDHSVKVFFEKAEKEEYFQNTVFIFAGDHGLPKKSKHMHPSSEEFALNSIHTPLVIYSPKISNHEEIDYPVSEVDIMATVAGLSGSAYVNSTFGRDMLEDDFDTKEHYAFRIQNSDNPELSLIGEKYIYMARADGSEERLYEYYYKEKPENLKDKYPEVTKSMRELCFGIYENTRYTRYHNATQHVQELLTKSD